MLEHIYKLSPSDISAIVWTGDSEEYDLELYELDQQNDKRLAINPHLSDPDLIHYIESIPETNKCVVWKHEGEWIAKLFTKGWDIDVGYEEITITKPTFVWRKNQDLDRLMTFEDDPFGDFDPGPWDCHYKLVWYIDPRFNPLSDKVWAISCQQSGRPVKGVKDMGYLTPLVSVEFNEDLPDLGIDIDQCCPPFYDLAYECAYELDPVHTPEKRMWAVKFTPAYRKPKEWKWCGIVSPQFDIEYNPDLPEMEYDIDYVIPWHDLGYEHVWMLDNKHLTNGEAEIWALRVRVSKELEGSKIVDYISPQFDIEYNPDLPEMNYDITYVIPWHDLGYEHVWMLDNKHLTNGEAEIWAFKIAACNIEGSKIVDYISPRVKFEYNPDLIGYKYNIDYVIPYYDFAFEHMLMLDKEYSGEFDIWAVKFKVVNESSNTTTVGSITPSMRTVTNPALSRVKFNVDYQIPYHDRKYEHVWYLDDSAYSKEKIWAVRMSAVSSPTGEKEMGMITPLMPDVLDVIFISYYEPNAEENWQRVLEKAPYAKRVDGVKGIFEAHKAAANLASTDMFYVVDGDAWLVDEWQFDFQPGIFDRDCAYVWSSINPVNDLTYQNGGVKLLSKKILMKQKKWTTLDMFTGIMPKIKAEDTISCITRFNVDKFTTWRSAFRECVKLYTTNQMSKLNAWLKSDVNKPYGEYAALGAKLAYQYAKENKDNHTALLAINNYSWLEQQFKEITNDKEKT